MAHQLVRRLAAAAAAGLVVLTAAGCGGDEPPEAVRPVPDELVPATLDNELSFIEHKPARAKFDEIGDRSLVSEGRLWELRQGARLVGSLEIATTRPDVDTNDPEDRKLLLGQLLTGIQFETVEIDGVQVAAARQGEKAIFVWFGDQMFEIFQIKGRGLDPASIADRLIRRQRQSGLLPAEPSKEGVGADEEYP